MAPVTSRTLGDYRLQAVLGQGGMGEVYRAQHTRLGRIVALKILRDSSLSARFLNEARIQAGLTHPHIATLYDYFESGGRACIAMELVEGETFADRLHRRGAVSYDEAVTLIRPVSEAVAYLHRHGIIHRDLKAHNVKVTPDGHVKLLDFGIAKDLGATGLTQAGMVPGTPEYLSPEQVRGKAPDARSDVWSLGVLFYELVTGDLPFDAPSSFELFQRIARAEYDPPSHRIPGLPSGADALVARCLEADPSRRFPDASAFLAALPASTRTSPKGSAPVRRPGQRPRTASPGLGDRLVGLGQSIRPRADNVRRGVLMLAILGGIALTAYGIASLRPTSLPLPGGTVVAAPDVNEPTRRPADAVPTEVTINTFGPPADVYRNGVLIGQTPYPLATYVGESIELTLRRGDAEQLVQFQTSVGQRAYSFELPSP